MLQNRFGIIFGVANKRSIAWATAQALSEAGARLAFTYQGERLKENVESLTRDMEGSLVVPCDVTKREEVDEAFRRVREEFGRLDFLIHSVAYAPKEELEGAFVDTSRDGFLTALEVSAYSLTSLAHAAVPLMTDGGSIVSMSYYGAEKVVPNYNVMGVAKAALEASTRYLAADLGQRNIRVNAISAGPINTLAAAGIGDFRYILKWNEYNAPLRRTVTIDEVGESAVYLLSPMARGVTGEILHVDAGYHIVGMKHPAAPDIAAVRD